MFVLLECFLLASLKESSKASNNSSSPSFSSTTSASILSAAYCIVPSFNNASLRVFSGKAKSSAALVKAEGFKFSSVIFVS
jgi:hypothetical protein